MSKPTDKELKILQILWDMGPSSVRSVHKEISQDESSGYTTTLKLMQIMAEKGLATRDTSERTHNYSPSASESDTKQSLLKSFIASTFKGSSTSLVMQLLGDQDASQNELNEIKELISQLENK